MKISVSIVEDDAPVRASLAKLIDSSSGCHCVSRHGSAEKALQEIPGIKPDVVLMDINLPGINGVECVRRLKPLLPATQIIMLTVYQNTENIFDALAAGATGYLLKQTPPDELLAAIQEVHAGGSPMSSHIARKIVLSFQQAPPLSPGRKASRRGRSRCWTCWRRDFFTRKLPRRQKRPMPPFTPTSATFTKSSTCGRGRRPWPDTSASRRRAKRRRRIDRQPCIFRPDASQNWRWPYHQNWRWR